MGEIAATSCDPVPLIDPSACAGDGLIQEAELQHVMRACMDENGMNFDEDSIEELTHALFQVMTQYRARLTLFLFTRGQ
jgi:hypothetical protein